MITMKHLTMTALILAAGWFSGPTASAGHDSLLYRAADAYRDAVLDFERHVFSLRGVDRYNKRLVDDLEDASGDLRAAARHPDDWRRLSYRWGEVQALQQRVEFALLEGPTCHPDPVLIQCWERVRYAYAALAEQIGYHHPAGRCGGACCSAAPRGDWHDRPQHPAYRAPTTRPPRHSQHFGWPMQRHGIAPGDGHASPRRLHPGDLDRLSPRPRLSPLGATLQRPPVHPSSIPGRHRLEPSSGREMALSLAGAVLSRILD